VSSSVPNFYVYELPKYEKEKWDPHFGISGFGTLEVPVSEHQYIPTSENAKKERLDLQFEISEFGNSWIQQLISTDTNLRNAKQMEGYTNASGFRGSELCEFKCPKLQHIRTSEMQKGKVGPTFRGFGLRELKYPNNKHMQTSKMRKRKSGACIFGFRGSGLHEFQCPNIIITQLPKCEKEKWGPHFMVLGFGTSWVPVPKHQDKQTFEMRKKHAQHFGILDSKSRNFKSQNIKHKQFPKLWKGTWTKISEFRDSGFQMPNNNTQQLSNFERWKDVGPTLRDFGIRDFGFSKSKQQYTTTLVFQKVNGCGTNT